MGEDAAIMWSSMIRCNPPTYGRDVARCRLGPPGIDSLRGESCGSHSGETVMPKFVVGIGVGALTVGLVCGCVDSLANQAKKDPNSIIGKKTDKIEKFDPNAKQEVSDSKVRVEASPLYAMDAYRPAVEQIEKMKVEHALDLYNASEGHYPKDYEEFMTRVVKPNGITLAVLPGGWKYAYDVENHKLVVVHAPEAAPNGKKP